jgi:GAF domain-containing protein
MAAQPGVPGKESLAEDVQRIAEEQAGLRRVATLVARAASPEEVFDAVAAEAGRVLPAAITVLARYDPDGATVVTVGTWSGTGTVPAPVGTRTDLGGRNVSTLVFETGRPARIDDYADFSGPLGNVARGSTSKRPLACRSVSGVGCGAS